MSSPCPTYFCCKLNDVHSLPMRHLLSPLGTSSPQPVVNIPNSQPRKPCWSFSHAACTPACLPAPSPASSIQQLPIPPSPLPTASPTPASAPTLPDKIPQQQQLDLQLHRGELEPRLMYLLAAAPPRRRPDVSGTTVDEAGEDMEPLLQVVGGQAEEGQLAEGGGGRVRGDGHLVGGLG